MISALGSGYFCNDFRTVKDAAGLDGIIHPMEMWELLNHVFDAPAWQDLRDFQEYDDHRFNK